jgi:hypothetical protein
MALDRTELVWAYIPVAYFEEKYVASGSDYDLAIEEGRAVAVLRVPQDPVPADLEARIEAHVKSVFLVRQVQNRREYSLERASVFQYVAGAKNVTVRAGTGTLRIDGGQLDFVHRDAAGNIVRDSKAERIAANDAFVNTVAPKLSRSPTLHAALTSFSRSISDPADELVHLYEVRDALAKHYGSEDAARAGLGISKTEWQRLGILANAAPLEEGRHRGKHIKGRRNATQAELDEARTLTIKWITAFAATL